MQRSTEREAARALAALSGIVDNGCNGGDGSKSDGEDDPADREHESDKSDSEDDPEELPEDAAWDERNSKNNNPAGLFGDVEDGTATAAGENKYQWRYCLAIKHIAKLEGKTVLSGQGLDKINWRIVGSESVLEDSIRPEDLRAGVKPEFDFFLEISCRGLFITLAWRLLGTV